MPFLVVLHTLHLWKICYQMFITNSRLILSVSYEFV